MLTAIVDYDSGNLHSAHKAFERMAREGAHGDIIVTSEPDTVLKADRVVLPGDGAFPACRKSLFDHKGIFEAVEEVVIRRARPFMGICIGMQMLATRGLEYESTEGFDWIAGEVRKITPSSPACRVPHMGWNALKIEHDHPVFEGIEQGKHCYFVHSYHFVVAAPSQRLASTDHGGDITAVVGRDNLVGVQFHPEKSQETGLRMIANFLGWKP
ncbi:imidazole glycerol phosphate synthase subunit HisH [Lentibacter sp. XHP0401]|uniref:imidazole glycerol phosphate synthase subunit HisH n=1 Tax=Lentibacter sp. XHP0401 TaxID=2984334 RepID=UPI0021E7E4A3|nr:imidazole glycerol phosphate synthase subunit HisH [Lentibacter sp. XHP0401]MCV2893329.1 imidazole glycerol phosphate synthase subunit HisH [Lentibacter sp. XHP0401]